jgi:tetratricopeptide (TPR) repeat protein
MNLAESFEYIGRDDEGVKYKIREVDGRRRVFGEEHYCTLAAVQKLWETVQRLSTSKYGGSARAMEFLEAIAKAEPHSGAAWTALGMARYEAGQWKPALEAIEKSLASRKGGGPYDWLLLSMAHSRFGNEGEARSWYDQASRWFEKSDPDNLRNDANPEQLRSRAALHTDYRQRKRPVGSLPPSKPPAGPAPPRRSVCAPGRCPAILSQTNLERENKRCHSTVGCRTFTPL